MRSHVLSHPLENEELITLKCSATYTSLDFFPSMDFIKFEKTVGQK